MGLLPSVAVVTISVVLTVARVAGLPMKLGTAGTSCRTVCTATAAFILHDMAYIWDSLRRRYDRFLTGLTWGCRRPHVAVTM